MTSAEENLALAQQVAQQDLDLFLPVSHSVNLLGLQISARTVQKRLNEANIPCYCAEYKIDMNNRQKNNRVAFALKLWLQHGLLGSHYLDGQKDILFFR